MSIVVLQTYTAAPGRFEELQETLAAMLVDTAARQGAECMHAAGNPETGVITIYEQWDGPQNQQAYVAWRMQTTDMSKFGALLGGAPKIEQLQHIF